MAKQYVEASAVECVLDHAESKLDGYSKELINWVKYAIHELPEANVRRVEEGYWKFDLHESTDHVRCSICKYRNFRNSFSRFCPNCGSYMRNYKEIFIDS